MGRKNYPDIIASKAADARLAQPHDPNCQAIKGYKENARRSPWTPIGMTQVFLDASGNPGASGFDQAWLRFQCADPFCKAIKLVKTDAASTVGENYKGE